MAVNSSPSVALLNFALKDPRRKFKEIYNSRKFKATGRAFTQIHPNAPLLYKASLSLLAGSPVHGSSLVNVCASVLASGPKFHTYCTFLTPNTEPFRTHPSENSAGLFGDSGTLGWKLIHFGFMGPAIYIIWKASLEGKKPHTKLEINVKFYLKWEEK